MADKKEMRIKKKLSMRELVGDVKKFIPMKEIEEKRGDKTVVKEVPDVGGETVWLANVVGIARGIKTGMSSFGEWAALMGDFIAVPLVGDDTGKQYRTGQIFLPDVILNMISASMDGNTGVEFAFKVGIYAADDSGDRASATGYEYTADFLIDMQENDPLATLMQKALPAPKK